MPNVAREKVAVGAWHCVFLEVAFSVQKATSKLLNNAFYAILAFQIKRLPWSDPATGSHLERRRLVGRVVIHVRAGIAVPRFHDEGHDRVKCRAFLLLGLRPERSIDRLASLAEAHDAKEVLSSAFAHEWVAFEIQK